VQGIALPIAVDQPINKTYSAQHDPGCSRQVLLKCFDCFGIFIAKAVNLAQCSEVPTRFDGRHLESIIDTLSCPDYSAGANEDLGGNRHCNIIPRKLVDQLVSGDLRPIKLTLQELDIR